MNATLRRIVVSGSAAVALLGGAAAITVASPTPASAADFETAVNRATGTPVQLPDGRTAYVRGMDAAAYTASPEHTRTIVLAAAKDEGDPGIGTGLTPDSGSGAALQNPNQPTVNGQTPANSYNPQQIQTQASGGAIGAGVVAILVLGIIVVVRVRGKDVKVGDAVVLTLFGIAVSGTVIGALGDQLTDSAIGSLGSMLGGL